MYQQELPLFYPRNRKSSDERKGEIIDWINTYAYLSYRDVAGLCRISKTRSKCLIDELIDEGYVELYATVPSGNPQFPTKLFQVTSKFVLYDDNELWEITEDAK